MTEVFVEQPLALPGSAKYISLLYVVELPRLPLNLGDWVD